MRVYNHNNLSLAAKKSKLRYPVRIKQAALLGDYSFERAALTAKVEANQNSLCQRSRLL